MTVTFGWLTISKKLAVGPVIVIFGFPVRVMFMLPSPQVK